MSLKLSFIIPVYNSQKYLNECLNSICKQIKKDAEVIIVDDCSNDKSYQISRKFCKKYNFVKIFKLKKNRGVSYSRNIGIKKAVGDYLCFIDSDDKLSNEGVSIILKHLKLLNYKDIFVIRNLILNNKKKKVGSKDNYQTFKLNKKSELVSCTKNLSKFRPTCWNFIVRKKFIKENNISFKEIITAEDWVFVSEILCLCKNFYLIDKPIYIHRAYEINTLGRVKGFVRAWSVIKVILELVSFIEINSKMLNEEKKLFLFRIINMSIKEFFLNIILCNNYEIKKISEKIAIKRSVLKSLLKYNIKNFTFLLKTKKPLKNYLINFNKQKDNLIINYVKKFKSKNIILFCAGRYGRSVLEQMNKIDIKIHAIVDNNASFQNIKVENLKVKSPNYLKKNLKRFVNYNIFICNQNKDDYKKVKKQLRKFGYNNLNILQFDIL